MEEREKKPREGRRLENSATKTITLTPTPSTFSSSRTPSTATWSGSDGRSSADSCYFPGCRKDANCNCDICLASIDATRDLVRNTALISPHFLTKLSSTKTPAKRSLLLPEPKSPPATPEFGSSVTIPLTPPVQFTPPARSTAKSRPPEKAAVRKERRRGVGCKMLSLLAGWLLLWAVDSGLSAAVLRGFGPKLTADVVRQFGEESRVYGTDLKGRLRILQQKIDGVVGGGLSNCGSEDSVWELKQEGHLFFHWRCVIYKSAAEEVSIWGSPLRTSGLLPTTFSRRSLTLLSGRITEWSDGKLMSTLRASNSSSWTYQKWSSAAVQLDPETWVLEYERSALFHGPRLIPSLWELLQSRLSKTDSALFVVSVAILTDGV
ncbi:uncharacterized protein LOC109714391 [Ananas comosus]|uniref:Uncharacterized protein LOC109714391 n=1 Tax=Ananas comosus TaxID=4615 RepID=A0A6P5FEA2_ANACO|nr:uncharacterized protein LOC109714391 [Ananas comosus]